MKKLLLSIGAIFIGAASVNAQLLDETFDSSIPGTWTIIDVDNFTSSTGQAAYASWAWNSTDQDASSSSWYDNSGTGPTDDWLITPQVTIPGTGTYALSFEGWSHEATYMEEYEVLISTTGTSTGNFSNNELSVVNEPVTPTAHIIDLTGYAGQSIYIAFRHTSADESILHIDNVLVDASFPNDAKMVSVNTNATVPVGGTDITGTIKNEGTSNITTFDITWNDGTGPYSQTFNQTIAPGGTYNFTHGTQLNAVGGTTYNVDVCVVLSGDGDASDDCVSKTISSVSTFANKKTVGEEKTGTWCQWCPRGSVAMETMEAYSNFIGIAVHNGDPMVVSSYDGNIDTYIPGGYPGGGVDRMVDGDPADFPTMHAARENEIAPASISIAVVQNGSNMEVTVTADFVAGLSGDYRLAAVITEDNVTGTSGQWAQSNAYQGGGAGPLNGAGHDWTTAGNPVPASQMEYDHVARALGNNQILGSAGSLPGTVNSGDSESYMYSIPVGSTWELGNCHFIGMLVNGSTGEILNAEKTAWFTGNVGIEEEDLNGSLTVYPNPSEGLTNIKVELTENADVQLEIFNALGEVVYTENTTDLATGAYYYQVDVADFSSGIYTVRATINGIPQASKLSVR